MSSGSLYNGRTRLESREYEELMPYRFFCTQCSFRSKREGHMTKHLALHDRGVAVLKCPTCSYRTTRTGHLTRHQRRQHTNIAIVCSVDGCTYITSSERLFQRHLKSRHLSTQTQTSPSFPCTVPGCSYSGATESRLIRHRARHRAVEGQPSDTDLVECYQCKQCSYKTVQREHFRRHVDSVHKNVRPFLCDVCGRRFKRHDALLQHSVVHSDQSDTATRWSNTHQCTVCHRTFRSKSHLSDHESIHRTCRSFICAVCGATFKTRGVHRKHLLTIHTQPGAHVCHVCGRLFNTSFAMKRHSRMHQLQINSVDITAAATICLQPPQPTDALQSVIDGVSSPM